jgi:hypothetical protein
MIFFFLLQKISSFICSKFTFFSHTVELCLEFLEDNTHNGYFFLAFFSVSGGIAKGSGM